MEREIESWRVYIKGAQKKHQYIFYIIMDCWSILEGNACLEESTQHYNVCCEVSKPDQHES